MQYIKHSEKQDIEKDIANELELYFSKNSKR